MVRDEGNIDIERVRDALRRVAALTPCENMDKCAPPSPRGAFARLNVPFRVFSRRALTPPPTRHRARAQVQAP